MNMVKHPYLPIIRQSHLPVVILKTITYTLLLVIQLIAVTDLDAQNINRARIIMDTLASPAMYGRGYVNDGTSVAADYIASEMSKTGLNSFSDGYKQDFFANIKTYPGRVDLAIDSYRLKAGIDFVVMAGSPSIKGTYNIVRIDSSLFTRENKLKKLKSKNLSGSFIMYDPSLMKGKNKRLADSLLRSNYLNCAGFILIQDKPSIGWSVMAPEQVLPYPVINVLKNRIPANPQRARIDVELKVIDKYKLSNIIGYIPGHSKPDSFLVITAHYDHLGMLGNENYFPGANDNASGTAMMLDMADHYRQPGQQLPYSIIFIAFAGEELGLLGSKYCADHPPFDLKKVKFLINLDMVGTGSEGITMVNGEQFPEYYQKMVDINANNEYVLKVAKRGESCNSDHCPFYKKGVPAIFIYSMGKEHMEYHNINDRAEHVPLSEYEDIFRLIDDFIDGI